MPTYLAWFALEFLFFIQFNRQTIWVTEEYKSLACIFIRAYRLMRDAFTVKFINCIRKIIYLKSKMAQTGCFRIGRTCWWVREGE